MKHTHILLFLSLFISGTAEAGIYRGDRKESEYEALGAQPQFNCVGKILYKGEMKASCVLVSSKYILSATHVFIESSSRQDTMIINGATLIANKPYNKHLGNASDYSVVFSGKEYKCKALILYPHYSVSLAINEFDIAMLELEDPVTDIVPAIIGTGYNELNADVTGAGYGVYGPADKPGEIVDNNPKKLAGENVIDSIGGYVLNHIPTIMFCDFDNPFEATSNKMGSPVPRPLEYICGGGDSGGGLFMQTSKGWELIGICHGISIDVAQLMKTGYYGQIMSWTRVSVYAEWIKSNEK